MGNLKRSLDETHHAFKYFKYTRRYLAEATWRFNRRFRLTALVPRLLVACVRCKPWPEPALRSCEMKVVRNAGAPEVDGLTVAAFKGCLKAHWPTVKAALLAGHYQPSAVRAVDIPKPAGGVRTLGIPTVLDRLIQQALLQVLQPTFERTFSASSYGFRPGRSARQAVRAAKHYV